MTFNRDLRQFVDLLFSNRYEESAACLASLMAKYNGRDPLKKLDNELLGFQGYLLEQQGQHEQALAIYRRLKADTESDFPAFVTNQLALANLLEQMGQAAAATEELSLGLAKARQPDGLIILDLLIRYREIATAHQLVMPEGLRQPIRSVAQWGQSSLSELELASRSIEALVDSLQKALRR
jgi:tetratricopeptide (TPR) repeat protein